MQFQSVPLHLYIDLQTKKKRKMGGLVAEGSWGNWPWRQRQPELWVFEASLVYFKLVRVTQ